MPILDIELVVEDGEALAADLPQRLADAAAQVLQTPPGRTWVKLRRLPRGDYAESGDGFHEDIRPVFVQLLKAAPMSVQAREREAQRLTQAIAQACQRPFENVHILYLPPASGRAVFGGVMI